MKVAVFLTFNYSISTWYKTGTIEKELKVFKELTEKYGTNFTFFSYGELEDKNILKAYSNFDIELIFKNFHFKNKYLKLIYSFIYPLTLKKKIKKFDILHQHQLLGSWIGIISKILYKKPLLVRTGYDMYEFSTYENKKYSLYRIFLYYLTKFSLKYSDIYTVTSLSDLNFLKKTFKFENQKVKVRPNWVINNNFKSLSERKKFGVLSAGRLEDQKNYFNLINCFPSDSKFELVIYGDGSQYNYLKNEIYKKNLNVNLKLPITNSELLLEMNSFKYYITSSLYEGNPKTLLEAMSCGCIVLASNIKNHMEIINSKNGILFNLNNMNILEILTKLDNNLSQQKAYSKNAAKSVLEKNSYYTLVDKLIDDYKLLIK